jgi:DNA-binding MarR family transcriptional regulator
MQTSEEASAVAVVDAIVYALPDIVRGITATRGRLSPGLRTSQLRALLRITRDEGLTMGDLARHIGVSCAAATQVVDQLVELGLVTRERKSGDRRVVRLRLTELAHAELDAALARRAAQVREVCAQLSPEEARAFAKGMELLGTVLMRDAVRAAGEVAA